MKELSSLQAARVLGIPVDSLKTLEEQGLLHVVRKEAGKSFYSYPEIERIKAGQTRTVADEATQVRIKMQREMAASISTVRKTLLFAGGVVSAYALLVAIFVAAFIIDPLKTAQWLGITKNKIGTSAQNEIENRNVLAASTGQALINQPSPLQAILQPVGKVSLGIVKDVNPQAYAQVAVNTIIDPNDILSATNGVITTQKPINFPNSSLLQVGSNGLVANLNSQYLQGRQPGTAAGDIAIVGSIPTTPVTTAQTIINNTTTTTATGLTNVNLSGNAGITNNNLANSTINVSGTGGITTSGSPVSLGGTVTIDGSGISSGVSSITGTAGQINTSSSTGAVTLSLASVGSAGTFGNATTIPVITTDAQGRITGVVSTTISGLTASNLTAGDYSSKINTGTYSINISGNAATATSATSATNFTGSLSGDVSGTQTTTSVDKIKGVALGTTTATSGNLLIANGASWTTKSLSGDGTLTSAGVLTLKNTGTSGTYGSATVIPVLTTDAQGRVTNITNTTITGLTNSNLSGSAGITNANLANSSVTVNTSSPLGGGGAVSLGGSLTLTCPTCLTSGGSLFTAAATSGSNSTISQGGALTLAAGSNISTTGNGTGTVTFATITTPTFTTINGLTITNNGTNTLTIAAGKTLTINNSLTFSGTDSTSFTLPSSTDTLVGRGSTDTLTNKTIAAGSNTISGLTNSNLSGSAGITNANLANSSITINTSSPLGGGGLASLGGSLTLTCSTCGGSVGLSSITAATGSNSINNGDNAQTWDWSLTTAAKTAFTFGENSASTNGAGSQYILGASTLASSTAAPFFATARGNKIIDTTSVGGVTIGNATAAQTISIDAGTGAINIGNSANGKAITIGSSTAGGTLALTGGPTWSITTAGTLSTSGNISTTGSGTITSAGNLTANGTTLSIGNGSAATINTPSGNAALTIIPNGTGGLNLATTNTGNVVIGNATGTFRLISSGGLNVSTAGALTGVASIDTITTSGTALTFAGAGTINSTGTNAVTLDSGTTGNVNVGNNANAKAILIGNTTGATSLTLDAGTGGIVVNGLLAQTNGKVTVCFDTATHQLFQGATQSSCNTSSERFKHDIQPLALGLDAVNRLRPVSYEYNGNNESSLGFIAEEAAQVDERLIVRDAQGLPFAIDPVQFTPILTKGLQELDLKVNNLGLQVNSLATPTLTPTPTPVDLASTITQALNNWAQNLVEFFNNVIFHADVTFLGRPTFNKDTAGHATISAGGVEVAINFAKENTYMPVVTATVNVTGGTNLDNIPSYAVSDITTKGFKIKLSRAVGFDLNFSWIALAINGVNTSVSTSLNPTSAIFPTSTTGATTPTPTSGTVSQPTATPVAAQTLTPSPTSAPSSQPSPTSSASAATPTQTLSPTTTPVLAPSLNPTQSATPSAH